VRPTQRLWVVFSIASLLGFVCAVAVRDERQVETIYLMAGAAAALILFIAFPILTIKTAIELARRDSTTFRMGWRKAASERSILLFLLFMAAVGFSIGSSLWTIRVNDLEAVGNSALKAVGIAIGLGALAISEIAKLPRDVTLFLILFLIIQIVIRVQTSELNELKLQLTEGRLGNKHEPFDELWGKTVRCDSILVGDFDHFGIREGLNGRLEIYNWRTSSTILSLNEGILSLHRADGHESAAIRVDYGEVMFRIGGPSNMWMTIPPTTPEII
jgi:hypothetical protein